jgi:hypothetical protein
MRSKPSRRRVPTTLSQIAFASGARAGVRMTSKPDLQTVGGEHHVEASGELGVPIADEEPETREPLSQFPSSLGHPRLGRVGGDAAEMGPARGVFNEDEHVQALKERRIDAEEVTGEDAFGLGRQELRPGRVLAAWSGVDLVSPQDQPHGEGCHAIAHADQLRRVPGGSPRSGSRRPIGR